MDRAQWLILTEEGDWNHWKMYMETADGMEGGRWTVWALNLLARLCEECGCKGQPKGLPRDVTIMREAMDRLLESKSEQLQRKGIRMLRNMLQSDPSCDHLMDYFPRHRRREVVNRITRQRRPGNHFYGT